VSARTLAAVAVALALCACSGGSSGGDGGADASKPNLCAGKANYVFDTAAGGFDLAACGAFADVEKATETDGTRAATLITPLAGVKLPVSMPYKFTWTTASFPSAPSDGGAGDTDGGASGKLSGVGYVVSFVDANTSKELLRVHTTDTAYTPDAPSWAKLVAAAKMPGPPALQIKIVAALFADGAIAAGTNPVTGTQPRLVYLDPTM